ncbi:hypothetical protein [Pararhizobium arenae]|uniref:hypothetical protein n=1 Tax=Pararhizobium arenae TaxID=1856850 RepID=UPI00094B400C|nr:hypothetical protein [Pararhizobium arenae]
MFKKTFFIAALALSSVSFHGLAHAQSVAQADIAISAISGCSAATCEGLVDAALAEAQALPPGPEKDALLARLVAAIAEAAVNNPEIATALNAKAQVASAEVSPAGRRAAATAATGTTDPGSDDGASRGDGPPDQEDDDDAS